MCFYIYIAFITLGLQTTLLHANIDSLISKSHEIAKTNAKKLVQNDFNVLMMKIASTYAENHHSSKNAERIRREFGKLEKEMIALSHPRPVNVTRPLETQRKHVWEAMDRYSTLLAYQTDLSYQTAEWNTHVNQAPALIKRFIEDFQNQCKIGRSDSNTWIVLPTIPSLPKPYFRIAFWLIKKHPQHPEEENEATSALDIGGSLTYLPTEAEPTTATEAQKITQRLATDTYPIVAIPGGGVVYGAIVAINALATLASLHDLHKQQRQIVDDSRRLFENAATDRDLQHYYRQNCKGLSQRLTLVTQALDEIDASGENRQTLKKELKESKQEIEQWDISANRLAAAYCRKRLTQAYLDNSCKPRSNKQTVPCFIDRDNKVRDAHASGKTGCIIDTDRHLRSLQLSRDQTMINQDAATYDDAKNIKILRLKMIDSLLALYEIQQVQLFDFDVIKQLNRKIRKDIFAMSAQIRKSHDFGISDASNAFIITDRKSFHTYRRLTIIYLALQRLIIQKYFGKRVAPEIEQMLDQWQSTYMTIDSKFQKDPQIKRLYQLFDDIKDLNNAI